VRVLYMYRHHLRATPLAVHTRFLYNYVMVVPKHPFIKTSYLGAPVGDCLGYLSTPSVALTLPIHDEEPGRDGVIDHRLGIIPGDRPWRHHHHPFLSGESHGYCR
jgi:hypothetical protein